MGPMSRPRRLARPNRFSLPQFERLLSRRVTTAVHPLQVECSRHSSVNKDLTDHPAPPGDDKAATHKPSESTREGSSRG